MSYLKEEAYRRGVSERCWQAGNENACGHCREVIMEIMDERYKDVHPDILRSTIARDIMNGQL